MTKPLEMLNELLSTPEGADRLKHLLRFMPSSTHDTQEMVPLNKIVWNASHRVSNSVTDTDEMKPVSLCKITIAGRDLYFVNDGNHRCEARSNAGQKDILANVSYFEARLVEVHSGINGEFKIYRSEGRRDWRNKQRIDREEVDLLEKLGLLSMEVEKAVAPPPVRKSPLRKIKQALGIGD